MRSIMGSAVMSGPVEVEGARRSLSHCWAARAAVRESSRVWVGAGAAVVAIILIRIRSRGRGLAQKVKKIGGDERK